jgi:hypothetical protein
MCVWEGGTDWWGAGKALVNRGYGCMRQTERGSACVTRAQVWQPLQQNSVGVLVRNIWGVALTKKVGVLH